MEEIGKVFSSEVRNKRLGVEFGAGTPFPKYQPVPNFLLESFPVGVVAFRSSFSDCLVWCLSVFFFPLYFPRLAELFRVGRSRSAIGAKSGAVWYSKEPSSKPCVFFWRLLKSRHLLCCSGGQEPVFFHAILSRRVDCLLPRSNFAWCSAKLFLPSENRKQHLVGTMLCLKNIFIGDAGDANKVFEIVDVGEFEVCCL